MTEHIPVLLQEVIEGLDPQKGEIILDGTVGGGGHSKLFCKFIGTEGVLIGIDADAGALRFAKENLKDCSCRIELVVENFKNLDIVLSNLGIGFVHKLLFDLGMSNFQINPPDEGSGRGFSFMKDEPLLMTFSESQGTGIVTAEEIVNEWSEETIADILYGFGEERFSRRIAEKIVEARQAEPIKRTGQLVHIIEQSVPFWYRHKKIHPATKTFQALRIAVNDETNVLHTGLSKGFDSLARRGRMAVITFHSIEDRIVKRFFRGKVVSGEANFINKRPIEPTKEEILSNRKARSAKLRVIEKVI